MTRILARPLIAAALLAAALVAQAAPVGEIEYVDGLATLSGADQQPRFVTKGEALSEGDTLTVSGKGFAILSFKDGTKTTLRPGTVFRVDKFSMGENQDGAILRLIKGGMRTLTGLIGKRSPGAMEVHTATATIGIRGTDFDARLCTADCTPNAAPSQPVAQPPANQVAQPNIPGRVAFARGEVEATDREGRTRKLSPGAALYEGDTLKTGKDAYAVLAFSDQGKITLQADTSFRIDTYQAASEGKKDSIVLNLLRGGLRALTGLIGKRNPDSFALKTPTATIGIRGTGLDAVCVGRCAEGMQPHPGQALPQPMPPQANNGLFVHTWNGTATVTVGEKTFNITLNQTGFVDVRGNSSLLRELPVFMKAPTAPRPDGVQVDFKNLFGSQATPAKLEGLVVAVRDGHVVVKSDEGKVDLGRGEVALLQIGSKEPMRLNEIPAIIRNDPIPLPSQFSPAAARPTAPALGGTSGPASNQQGCEL